MAYFKGSLPSLKLIRRPTVGHKSVEILHRGDALEEIEVGGDALEENNVEEPEKMTVDDLSCSSIINTHMIDEQEPTIHKLECLAAITGWEQVREKMMFNVITEAAAMPAAEFCYNCKKSAATVRCQQCGPLGLFCLLCFKNSHRIFNILHVGEKWEVRIYIIV